MNKIFLIISALFFNNEVVSQYIATELINLSRKYYLSQKLFSVTVETRFKNAIIVDTIVRFENCFIDKSADIMVFESRKHTIIKNISNEYIFYFDPDGYEKINNKKHSVYQKEYSNYPFTETEIFFSTVLKDIAKGVRIDDSDSLVSLYLDRRTIVFRKKDYSIKGIIEIRYDALNKGFQIDQKYFSELDFYNTGLKNTLEYYLSFIKDPLKKRSIEKNRARPEYVEIPLIEENLKSIVNGKIVTIKDKTLLINFFYQGCFPCIKAYPFMNELYENADSNIIVMGIDHLERDSLTINRYIEKYYLKYPILIGKQAAFLTKYFNLNVFPMFLIIYPDGRINYLEGFTKNSFEKFVKRMKKH